MTGVHIRTIADVAVGSASDAVGGEKECGAAGSDPSRHPLPLPILPWPHPSDHPLQVRHTRHRRLDPPHSPLPFPSSLALDLPILPCRYGVAGALAFAAGRATGDYRNFLPRMKAELLARKTVFITSLADCMRMNVMTTATFCRG